MRAAVIQTSPTADAAANAIAIRRLIADAAKRGATLAVLPEETMLQADDKIKPTLPDLIKYAWPQFEQLLAELATAHNMTIIAGGYEPREGCRPYNTLLAVGPDGSELARYHKIHLYDAFSYQESEYVSFGEQLPPIVTVDGLRIGIANCYDLRFPELFRYLSDNGVDVISLSSAWVAGKGKEEHWTTLTQARAIENVSWVLAAGTTGTDTVGLSRIIDPLGAVVAGANPRDEIVIVADIDAATIASSRDILPALANRRLNATYSLKG